MSGRSRRYVDEDDNEVVVQSKVVAEHRRFSWLYIIVGLSLAVGIGFLIYALFFRRSKILPIDSTEPAPAPSSSTPPPTYVPSQHRPPGRVVPDTTPVDNGDGAIQNSLPSVTNTGAYELFTRSDMLNNIQILDTASAAQIFAETPDKKSLELAYGASSKINKMAGGSESLELVGGKVVPPNSLIVMIYRKDCDYCKVVSPLYANAARTIHMKVAANPTLPNVKFAAIDASQLPMYMLSHVGDRVPSFLIYSEPEDRVWALLIPNMSLLSHYIVEYHQKLININAQ